VSSWTSLANASGIAAVGASAVAVVAAISIAVRQAWSGARASSFKLTLASLDAADAARGLAVQTRHGLGVIAERSLWERRTDQTATFVVEVVNRGGTGETRIRYHFRVDASALGKSSLVARLLTERQGESLSDPEVLSGVLRVTAQDLEEQAEILAGEHGSADPPEG
jgi:hypothetical protein